MTTYRNRSTTSLIVLGIFVPWSSQFAKAHAKKFLGKVADSWAAQQMVEKPIVSLVRHTQK